MERFTHFLAEAKTADLANKRTFSLIVREGLALTGMSVRDAAELFRTAPGTVSRWENGHTAPPLVARRAVRDLLVTRVQRIASSLSRHAAVPA
jgi:DNA-binding transcriptional regulator YiaG